MQTMAARDAYELWAETYPPYAHNPLMTAEQDVVTRRLSTIRATTALDVGTGSGRCVPLLEGTGATLVVGADLSIGMLRRNESRHRVCADANQLPLPSGAFDLVNASLIAGDIADLGPWIDELARVLMPAGHLIYSDFHPAWDHHGWQRTFRTADGDERALPRASHQLEDHFAALERAGLDVLAAEEVSVPRGRTSLWQGWRRHSEVVAIVFHARKAVR